MEARLSLRYAGPAVDAGFMNVYDAAANMIAFSEFIVAAAKAAYGESVDVKAQAAGFARGSFVTDIVINVGGPLVTLFSSGNAKELLGVIAEAVKLWKHLRGAPPTQVQSDESNMIKVTNNNGKMLVVQAHTLNLVFGEKGTEAASKFIRDALSKDGIESVSVDAEHDEKAERVIDVSRQESQYFVPVAPETPLFDTTIKAALIIEAPVFKEDNKWRFSDGSGSFYANIEDPDFIALVDNGEPFAKGDSLIVEMRIRQQRQGEKLITEKTIIKVIEHRGRPNQATIF